MKNFYIKATTPAGWVRPDDWIPIPSISVGEQVIYALVMVTNQSSNYIAFLMQGAYTVDWGDGTITNYATNTQAEHNYSYASVGNTVTHNGVTYRQALIKITPQVANNLTIVNFQRTHSALPVAGTENYKVLDFVMNIPNMITTGLTIGGATTRYNYCKRLWIKQIGNITSVASLCTNMSALESLPLFSTSTVTNFTSFLQNCSSLKEVPLFDTGACTTATSMFNACVSLETVPLFNFAVLPSTSNMFAGCTSLKYVPQFNLSACVSMSTMFNGCTALQIVPALNFIVCTNVGNMFPACAALLSFTGNNMALVTTNITWLNGTESLESLILNGFKLGFNITNSNMGATELDALFTSLGTALPAQTITVTGNPGAATCNTAIATGKGFTVVT